MWDAALDSRAGMQSTNVLWEDTRPAYHHPHAHKQL